ncbi:MAG: hypothetical protein QOH37_1123, partial [Nocardioidaceae bacterium]|nr:hypothetical protein [Nocardioidaceae bacterium]
MTTPFSTPVVATNGSDDPASDP